jgi:soluble lytic murein transglycosylase-like protein
LIQTYDYLIKNACDKHLPGYDWRMLKAQYWQESKLDPLAVSPVGAVGIAQFMPKTWAEWSPKAGYAGKPATNPEASIQTGAMYMAYLIGQWKSPRPDIDRTCLALASYNAGLGNLLKAQEKAKGTLLYREITSALPAVTGEASKETMDYVRKILGYWVEQIA